MQISEVLKHFDEEEDGHWDDSPCGEKRFATKVFGADLYLRTAHSMKLPKRFVCCCCGTRRLVAKTSSPPKMATSSAVSLPPWVLP